MASSIVIKVKHGELLRRFNASVDETGKLDFDIARLRRKIVGLFNFHPDASFALNYTDEDGDIITLVDEDDLHDIMEQSLNPLRIMVKLNGSPNPITSLGTFLHLSPNLNTNVYEMLKSVPESFYETLSKLPLDLAYKAIISSVLEMVESVSKTKGSNMAPLQKIQASKKWTPVSGTSTLGSGKYDAELGSEKNDASVPVAKNDQSSSEKAPKIYTFGQKVDHDRVSTIVENPALKEFTERYKRYVQTSKHVQNLKEPKPVTNSASDASFECPFYIEDENPSAGKSGAGELPFKYGQCNSKSGASEKPSVLGAAMLRAATAIRATEDGNSGCHQCERCGVQILSGRFKISDDWVCKMCLKVESMKVRGHTAKERMYVPSKLNQVRLQKLNSSLIGDFSSIKDGAVLAPSTTFTKIWRMRNNGSDPWPVGTSFRMVEGDKLNYTEIVSLQSGLPVGREIDIAVKFTAPQFPGQYVSFWYMHAFGVPFGQYAAVFIQVAAPLKDDKSNNSSIVNSIVASASSSSVLGSGKNSGSTPKILMCRQKVDHEKLGTCVVNSSEDFKTYTERQENKETQNLKASKPVTTSAGAFKLPHEHLHGARKLGANETVNVSRSACAIQAKGSENRGGYQCACCGVQVVSGRQLKISEDVVCKMCFEVENRKIRGPACVPSRLNQVRLRKINSSLIGHFSSISNGAVLAPSTPFTIIWRMRNSGSNSWPKGTNFTMVEGDVFSNTKSVPLQIPENGLPVGSEIDIVVNFVAPEVPGQYVSFWHVTAFGMPIGQSAVAFIQVAGPLKDDESNKSSCADSSLSSASSTSETAPKIFVFGQKHERLNTCVTNSSGIETCNGTIHRKVLPSTFPKQESKEATNLKESEPVAAAASGTSSENTCSGENETPNVGRADCASPAKESGNQRGYQCARCGVQIVSIGRFKISEDVVCKMCSEVENRKIRGPACVPSRLNQVRLRKISSSLLGDFSSVSNGTVLAPSTAFTKTWRMRNNGSDSWPKGTKFSMVEGDRFSNTSTVLLQIPENGLSVGSEIYISVDFIAPKLPGQYVSFWHVTAFGMPIGQSAVAFIQVKDDKSHNALGVDLNASPESSSGLDISDDELGIDLNVPPESSNASDSGNSSDSSDDEDGIDLNASPDSRNSSDSSDDETGFDLNASPESSDSSDGSGDELARGDIEPVDVDDQTVSVYTDNITEELKLIASMREVETACLYGGGSDMYPAHWCIDLNLPPRSSKSEDELVRVTVPSTKEEVVLSADCNDNQERDASTCSDSDGEIVPTKEEEVLNANRRVNQECDASTSSDSGDELVHVTGHEWDVSTCSSSDDELVHVTTKEEVIVNADHRDNQGRDVSACSSSDDELVQVSVPPTKEEVTLNANCSVSTCSDSYDELVHVTVPATNEEVMVSANRSDNPGSNVSTCSDSDDELVHVTVPAATKEEVKSNADGDDKQEHDIFTCSSSDDELVHVTVPATKSKYRLW